MPTFKIVNQLRVDWLGQCVWRFGKKTTGEEWCEENTVIQIQRSIMGDHTTLCKIVAHELCHHADNLINLVPEFKKMGYHSFMIWNKLANGNGHGKGWLEMAARVNAKYGADFVTITSDQSYVVKPSTTQYFVLMNRWSSGKLYYQAALRLTPKAHSYLGHLKEKGNGDTYRITQTTDPQFLHGPPIRWLAGWAQGRDQAALEALWAKAKPL